MSKKRNLIVLSILCVGYFYGCVRNEGVKLIKKYYPSGELKSYGYYIHDTIPIDTINNFFENGKRSSLMVYDSSGILHGQTIFYFQNGNVYQIINYNRGLSNNFFYEFIENGGLKSKIFFINDLQLGDSYAYNNTGSKSIIYNFYDFKGHNINFIEYDSLSGRIIKDERQNIFIDSIHAYNDSLDKEHERSYDVQIVISNPPKCRSLVKIDYVSKNGFITRTDSIAGLPYYSKKERLSDSILTIKIFGSQYDSLKDKSTYQESNIKLVYEKE